MESTIIVHAQLVSGVDEHAANLPGSWFISHQLGGPARNTYTEVAFAPGVVEKIRRKISADEVNDVIDTVVRDVAMNLYSSRYAFIYPPEEYVRAIEAYRLRRRERAVVINVDIY